jgi:hypothetical protein
VKLNEIKKKKPQRKRLTQLKKKNKTQIPKTRSERGISLLTLKPKVIKRIIRDALKKHKS